MFIPDGNTFFVPEISAYIDFSSVQYDVRLNMEKERQKQRTEAAIISVKNFFTFEYYGNRFWCWRIVHTEWNWHLNLNSKLNSNCEWIEMQKKFTNSGNGNVNEFIDGFPSGDSEFDYPIYAMNSSLDYNTRWKSTIVFNPSENNHIKCTYFPDQSKNIKLEIPMLKPLHTTEKKKKIRLLIFFHSV